MNTNLSFNTSMNTNSNLGMNTNSNLGMNTNSNLGMNTNTNLGMNTNTNLGMNTNTNLSFAPTVYSIKTVATVPVDKYTHVTIGDSCYEIIPSSGEDESTVHVISYGGPPGRGIVTFFNINNILFTNKVTVHTDGIDSVFIYYLEPLIVDFLIGKCFKQNQALELKIGDFKLRIRLTSFFNRDIRISKYTTINYSKKYGPYISSVAYDFFNTRVDKQTMRLKTKNILYYGEVDNMIFEQINSYIPSFKFRCIIYKNSMTIREILESKDKKLIVCIENINAVPASFLSYLVLHNRFIVLMIHNNNIVPNLIDTDIIHVPKPGFYTKANVLNDKELAESIVGIPYSELVNILNMSNHTKLFLKSNANMDLKLFEFIKNNMTLHPHPGFCIMYKDRESVLTTLKKCAAALYYSDYIVLSPHIDAWEALSNVCSHIVYPPVGQVKTSTEIERTMVVIQEANNIPNINIITDMMNLFMNITIIVIYTTQEELKDLPEPIIDKMLKYQI